MISIADYNVMQNKHHEMLIILRIYRITNFLIIPTETINIIGLSRALLLTTIRTMSLDAIVELVIGLQPRHHICDLIGFSRALHGSMQRAIGYRLISQFMGAPRT